MIKDVVEQLKSNEDAYSFALKCMFLASKDEELSALCQLPYILDKKNLFALCEYYGGKTIKIPTTWELTSVLSALLLYIKVNLNGCSYEQTMKELSDINKFNQRVEYYYKIICKAIKDAVVE